jgi:NTE family protein
LFQSLLRRSRNGDRGAEATPDPKQPIVERPTIGLALGGGAARGFAHIGILRVLLEHNIVPDVVVGTSIGAVVGGAYVAGHLDTLETWALALTKRGILGYLDVSLSGAGLIGGNRLALQLENAIGGNYIDKLPKRFAAITTEVSTGHEIWLTRGRLVDALRASYALPGIFPPVRIGGRWLVDGALVNPVPVSAARALGARLVIAVNLNADMLGRGSTISSHGSDENDERMRRELNRPRNGFRSMFGPERAVKRQFIDAGRPGIPTVMVEAFNIMQDRITRARLAGDPPDVLISPRLNEVGWFDFHRARAAIDVGALAAKRALEPIAEAINALSTYSNGVTPARK